MHQNGPRYQQIWYIWDILGVNYAQIHIDLKYLLAHPFPFWNSWWYWRKNPPTISVFFAVIFRVWLKITWFTWVCFILKVFHFCATIFLYKYKYIYRERERVHTIRLLWLRICIPSSHRGSITIHLINNCPLESISDAWNLAKMNTYTP